MAGLVGVLAFATGLPAARAATQLVRMVNFAYQPRLLTNSVGDTVLWTNTTTTPHNTVASNGLWSVGTFTSPGTFAFRFTNAGVYGYFCSPHLNFGMTGIIYVQGPPNTPPTVTLTDPTNGATLVAPATLTLRASASDTDGTVTNVQFLRGTNLLGTDFVSPFELVLNSLTSRTYNFTARAFDNGGAVSTSSVVSVSVVDLRFRTNLASAGNDLPLTLEVTPGASYQVEASSTLSNWAVVTNFTAATNTFTFSSPTTGLLRRLFRGRWVSGP